MAPVARPDPQYRIGDAERDAAVEALRAHFSEGRLSVEEFDERMGKALAATTAGDLIPLFTDLPRDPEAVGGLSVWRAPVPEKPRTRPLRMVQRWMIILAPAPLLLLLTTWDRWWIVYVIYFVVFAIIGRVDRELNRSVSFPELPASASERAATRRAEIRSARAARRERGWV